MPGHQSHQISQASAKQVRREAAKLHFIHHLAPSQLPCCALPRLAFGAESVD